MVHHKKEHRECDFCKTIEGQPRPIGLYIVKLSQININGTARLTCQTCRITAKKEFRRQNKSFSKNLKRYFSKLLAGF